MARHSAPPNTHWCELPEPPGIGIRQSKRRKLKPTKCSRGYEVHVEPRNSGSGSVGFGGRHRGK
eukprot:1847872-Rhodomonas_salina.2